MGFRVSNFVTSNYLDPMSIACRYDFLRCPESTVMSRFRNRVPPHLAPLPSAGNGWSPAGAIQYVFFRRSENSSYEIRPIAIGSEGDQVSGEALGTFHAMAKTGGHKSRASRYLFRSNDIGRLRTLLPQVVTTRKFLRSRNERRDFLARWRRDGVSLTDPLPTVRAA